MYSQNNLNQTRRNLEFSLNWIFQTEFNFYNLYNLYILYSGHFARCVGLLGVSLFISLLKNES